MTHSSLLLIDDDRLFGGTGVFVDLVPHSCWFSNARSALRDADWVKVRTTVSDRAQATCEGCGRMPTGRGYDRIEVHERWDYDPPRSVQTLRRLIALCTACHRATHFGLAQVKGWAPAAERHLARVNGWTKSEVGQHIQQAFAVWGERNTQSWALDLSVLERAGVTPVRPRIRL